MPDPKKQSVSASQASALFNASPYMTRWMLWQWFAGKTDELPEPEESTRMHWGKELQTPVLYQAERDLKFRIVENMAGPGTAVYYRRGLLGATRDATIWDPTRGAGCVEVKCVFDYKVWMDTWGGGERVPKHVEIQLQAGMYVGDGDGEPFGHGLIVVWVCGGNLVFFRRDPARDLWAKLEIEAGRFFASIENNEQPDPFGVPVEIPWLTKLYETRPLSFLDRTGDEELHKKLIDFNYHNTEESRHHKLREALRAQLMGVAGDYETVCLPENAGYRIVKAGKGKTVKSFGVEDNGYQR
jgi:YqaJ-like viral recombinase domain